VPVVVLICIVLFIVSAIRGNRRLVLSTSLALVGFIAVSGVLLKNARALRPWLRWLLWSRRYKAQLFAQPGAAGGGLKHTVLDTWGFVPSGFDVVYLVFDPADSLANAARSDGPGKPVGIPCEVPTVRRLEKQWYAVEFYTDEDWNHCPVR
jgi:hypothetical protein